MANPTYTLPRCSICGGTTWEIIQRPHPLYRGSLTQFAIKCQCVTNRTPEPDTKLAAAGGPDA